MNQMLPPRIIGTTVRSGVCAGLDIGCSKIACLIAHSDGQSTPVIKGVGVHASSGMKRGEVVDIDALSISIGKTVERAEQIAGFAIDKVSVSISGGKQQAQIRHHQIPISQNAVTTKDINRLLRMDMEYPNDAGRSAIHHIPMHYSLDGVEGIRDPRTMHGETLGLSVAVITAASSTLQNLTAAVERNHLVVDGFCASAYASGLASLTDDEKDLGTIVIEMGAGITTAAIFIDGHLRHLDSIPLGGVNVTADIARTLSTPMEEAERIKTLHGSILASIGEGEQTITLPRVGVPINSHNDDATQQIELGLLGEIIRPRVEEIIEILMGRMEKSGFSMLANHRLVLTGGAAELPGLSAFLSTLLDRPVRIGKPMGLVGMADSTRGAGFATTAGLVHFSALAMPGQNHLMTRSRQSRFWRLTAWLNAHL